MSGENTLLMKSKVDEITPSVGVYNRTLVETHMLLKSLKSQQQVLDVCTQGGHNLFHLFSRLMESISTECAQNSSILENIKSELEITISNNHFDVVSVFEILENSKKLLKYSKIIEQQNKLIQKNIANVIEVVAGEKYKIQNSTLNKLSSMVGGITLPTFGLAAVASVATVNAVLESGANRLPSDKKSLTISAVLGAFTVAGAAMDIISHCKDNDADKTLAILNKLQVKLNTIQSSSDQFALLINTVVDTFVNYVSSADKNTTYIYQKGTRTRVLASKMMKETIQLQKHLAVIRAKADENALQIMMLEKAESQRTKKTPMASKKKE